MFDLSKLIGITYVSLVDYLRETKRPFSIQYKDLRIDYGVMNGKYINPVYDHEIDYDIVGVTNIEILGWDVPVFTIKTIQ